MVNMIKEFPDTEIKKASDWVLRGNQAKIINSKGECIILMGRGDQRFEDEDEYGWGKWPIGEEKE